MPWRSTLRPTALLTASLYPPTLVRSTDSGATFAESAAGIGERFGFFGLAYDPRHEQRVWATVWESSGYWLYRSQNGGASWQRLRELAPFPDLAVDPEGRVYVTTGLGIEVSSDGGATWRFALSSELYVRSLSTDRKRAGRVWGASNREVWMSEDAGMSWRLVPAPEPADSLQIYDLAVVDGTVFLRTPDAVWRSHDEGASWTRLAEGLPYQTFGSLTIDANRNTRLWLAAERLGVFVGDFND
ncbi:MAG: hypothetical protein HC897_06505 [Thermoanaerobaculia bacterium]|nr:hypothetical protein [Thermoanaerobaculia bacterium]